MEQELELLYKTLNSVCELMEHYRSLKGETEFAKLIADYKYAALVGIQADTFFKIRKLESTVA